MSLVEINTNPSRKELRLFAAIWFPAFLLLVGFILRWRTGTLTPALILWGTGAALCLLGVVRPRSIRWVFVILMVAVYPIGLIVSHLILAALYYLIVTPIGLAMRLAGRDPMMRKLEPEKGTYWVDHAPAEGKEAYFRQY